MPNSDDRQHECGSTDRDASSCGAFFRVSHDADGECDQQEWNEPAQGSDCTTHDCGQDVGKGPRDSPPGDGRHHDRESDQGETQTVAPMGRVEFASSTAEPPCAASKQSSKSRPGCGAAVQDLVPNPGWKTVADLGVRLAGRRTTFGRASATRSGFAGLTWRGGRARLRAAGARRCGRTSRHVGRLASGVRARRTPRPSGGASVSMQAPTTVQDPSLRYEPEV